MRVRIKICGITCLEDGLAAIAAGADALGFNFYAGSSRVIRPDACAALIAQLPPLVTRVGLLVNPSAQELAAILSQVPLDVLQFHGEETAALCRSAGRPYIKAANVGPDFDMQQLQREFPDAQAFLLDAYVPGQHGGTGQTFDWQRWPAQADRPLILAGGLNPENVAAAIRATRPYAVDVSGGVEGAVRGRKDPAKVQAFCAAVRALEI